jgi:hypothetical protein
VNAKKERGSRSPSFITSIVYDYRALLGALGFRVPPLSGPGGGAACEAPASPACELGLLGAPVMPPADPVVEFSASPPPLRCDDPELFGAPELS